MGHDRPADSSELAALWDARYGSTGLVWSGAVNPRLVSEMHDVQPNGGRALDAGCGEGADSLWLAEQGWHVLGLDLSGVAVEKANAVADERGVRDRVRFEQRDLSTAPPPEAEFDLVAAHYLHVLPEHRDAIYGGLARAVRPGGTLLLVLHDASDIDAGVSHPPPFSMLSRDELAEVAAGFRQVSCVVKPREAVTRQGMPTTAHDVVLRAVR
ncbi:MAG TPA: class I SAM-dependent methyltransferase [Microcella sp.]|nr:class I SAM-dependent methyltransferase [Microcella sp.]